MVLFTYGLMALTFIACAVGEVQDTHPAVLVASPTIQQALDGQRVALKEDWRKRRFDHRPAVRSSTQIQATGLESRAPTPVSALEMGRTLRPRAGVTLCATVEVIVTFLFIPYVSRPLS